MEENNKFWEQDLDFIKGEYHLKLADICAKNSFQFERAAIEYRKSVYAFTRGTAYYLNHCTNTVPISEEMDDDDIFYQPDGYDAYGYNFPTVLLSKSSFVYQCVLDEKLAHVLDRLEILMLENCAEAMVAYCKCRLHLGRDLDSQICFGFYKKAAEMGNGEAYYELAECYRYALGVEKDLEKALESYKMAAQLGNGDAAYALGQIYSGHKVWAYDMENEDFKYEQEWFANRVNERIGATWFLKAAKLGNVNGQREISKCYSSGKGVPKNEELADVWNEVAKMKGKV